MFYTGPRSVSLRNYRFYLPGMIVLLAAIFYVFAVADKALAAGPEAMADLAEKWSPAVVNISTAQTIEGSGNPTIPEFPPGSPFEDFFEDFLERNQGGQPRKVRSLGSGFVIDEKGIIVTNNHVIAGADEIMVKFTDGTELEAVVIGKDPKIDIAILQVKPANALVAVELGNSQDLRVGDWVMAIGNPFGLGGTVTAGIVSARNRNINAGPYDKFIQTDASINRGNSGGPLFNMDGEVVGINSAIISPNGGSIGIGFAIPISLAEPVIVQLRKFGETRRGWLGVRIQKVTEEIADSLGLETQEGALVAGVTPGGPAVKAGLATGDVIVRFDGNRVPEMRDLPRIVADTGIGKTVDVVVIRDGKHKTFSVTIERLEEGEVQVVVSDNGHASPPATTDILGLELAALTDELREKYGLAPDTQGVLIVKIDPASHAAEKRLREGDVILEVSQHEVFKPEDVVARVAEVRDEGRKAVLLFVVNSAGDPRFVPVRIED